MGREEDHSLLPTRHSPLATRHLLLPYARLLRVPNVFTAMADIALGALATAALPENWRPFVWLVLASSFLYCGGMVWNDVFDIEQDRRERPFRPLPSGKIPLSRARQIGVVLLAGGLAWAALADWRAEGFRWHSLSLAGLLVVFILLYDGWLKRTWAGPLGMGACRFLNVLLGLSVVSGSTPTAGYLLALVVGLYIVGVTWFARTEAGTSATPHLGGAAAVMLAAVLLSLALPVLSRDSNLMQAPSAFFPYLLVAWLFFVGRPIGQALANPIAGKVQRAVKRAIFGLVFLDAVLATALIGLGGLVILLLLAPAWFLGRWVYST